VCLQENSPHDIVGLEAVNGNDEVSSSDSAMSVDCNGNSTSSAAHPSVLSNAQQSDVIC
jgi:hypothetical protein